MDLDPGRDLGLYPLGAVTTIIDIGVGITVAMRAGKENVYSSLGAWVQV